MRSPSRLIKWGSIVGLAGVCLYLVTLIFVAGQVLLGTAVLAGIGLAFFVYLSRAGHTYRYLFPGLAGIAVFVVFPLAYTIWVGFTNYSSRNLLTFARATDYFLQDTYQVAGRDYRFTVHRDGQRYRLLLTSEGETQHFVTPPLELTGDRQDRETEVRVLALANSGFTPDAPLPMREVIRLRKGIKELWLRFPDGGSARMAGLRSFAPREQRYQRNPDGSLTDRETGETLTPNFETGFFEGPDGKAIAPGFRVNIGFDNFTRVFTDPAFQQPFIRIFAWTLVFAGLTVLFTLVVGSTLAVLLSWEGLRFRSIYRMLLFLPYAVPGFISILVFKGLFNNNFGEINLILDALFGIKPLWFSDPLLAKTMLLIVNTWLGYPYVMVLCMGLLKSVPGDLYEASAIAGAGPLTNFFTITAPLLIKPLTPLLIASFAFNFNNFVLIALLTGGRPDFIGTQVPAGTTDILVSYTYRIAFEDSGKDFGLAGAIATLIFILVAILAIVQLRYMKIATAEARD